jgi:hypothetical protein
MEMRYFLCVSSGIQKPSLVAEKSYRIAPGSARRRREALKGSEEKNDHRIV